MKIRLTQFSFWGLFFVFLIRVITADYNNWWWGVMISMIAVGVTICTNRWLTTKHLFDTCKYSYTFNFNYWFMVFFLMLAGTSWSLLSSSVQIDDWQLSIFLIHVKFKYPYTFNLDYWLTAFFLMLAGTSWSLLSPSVWIDDWQLSIF